MQDPIIETEVVDSPAKQHKSTAMDSDPVETLDVTLVPAETNIDENIMPSLDTTMINEEPTPETEPTDMEEDLKVGEYGCDNSLLDPYEVTLTKAWSLQISGLLVNSKPR
ncbi:unnamed protein product [Arabis nemorensis]|uniref:Uncharacterized protein n=1 Tax=Arabis nemorensis TaxID=586526 RepID=A0A565C457_9BRAS|nr:unnamed protein product [Arabis nemorensis]